MCGGPFRPTSTVFRPDRPESAVKIPTEEAKFISLYYDPLTDWDRNSLLLRYLKDPKATHELRASLKPFTNPESNILNLFLTTSIVDLLMLPCPIDEKVDYFTLRFHAEGVKEALISYLDDNEGSKSLFSLKGEIVYSPMSDEEATARKYDIEVPSCRYSNAYFDKNRRLILTLVQESGNPITFRQEGDVLVSETHKIILRQEDDSFSSRITVDGAVVI